MSFSRPGGRAEQQFSLHPQVLTQEAAGNHPQMSRSLHLAVPTPEPRYIEELALEGPGAFPVPHNLAAQLLQLRPPFPICPQAERLRLGLGTWRWLP